ncbi:unnamed protein product [Lota lota]
MSAFTPAYVRRGPLEMSPVLMLLLLTSLAGIVSGQSAEDDIDGNTHSDDEEVTTTTRSLPVSDEPEGDAGFPMVESSSNYNNDSTQIGLRNSTDPSSESLDEEGLSPTIILVPVVLVVVIIGMIVCGIAMSRKWNQKMTTSDGMSDSYLNASSTEKVPMPMFDDDIPSVLELEMEDMDQWVEKHA